VAGVNVRARFLRPASLKGFCQQGFLEAFGTAALASIRPARRERKSGMTVLTWSDDRVEQLKKLWEAGLSASQIAAELGNVTRNAVIGKVHRLGLSGRAKTPSSAAPRQRKPRPAQHMMRVARPVSRGNTALAHAFEVELEPDPVAYDNVVPLSQRLSLLELNEATCHWPVGDPASPDFFFCGGKALAGLPYCLQHSRIAYQPAGDRRRHPPKTR
jgi:GcrA cell cycle regulator